MTSVVVDPVQQWNLAQTARLAIAYYQDAAANAPRRLFVKIAETHDPLADIFPGEFAFYAEQSDEGLPLARRYGAFRDARSGVTCILLEDLTATHRKTQWPLPPSLPDCEAAVAALARVHVHWWHAEELEAGASGPTLRAKEERLAAHVQTLLPAFFKHLGDRLPADRRDVVSAVCVRLPELKGRRLSDGRWVTRVHGDAHLWNVMYPKDPSRNGCVFIDWEDWRYDMAAADLALMIALHWYPDRRARHENGLLHRYLEVLQSGIPGSYGWEELLADYRLGHLQNVVVPVFQHQMGRSHGSWWSHLERWFLAFEDLGCEDLL